MEIGTADIIEEVVPKKKARRGLFGGSSSANGGNRNNGGGGGGNDDSDKPAKDSLDDPEPYVPNKSRILTAFVLLVVLMTFGGLVTAYIVLATNNVAEWKPFDLPIQLWISTGLILASSITYHFAKLSIDENHQAAAKKYLLVTT